MRDSGYSKGSRDRYSIWYLRQFLGTPSNAFGKGGKHVGTKPTVKPTQPASISLETRKWRIKNETISSNIDC